MTSGHALYRPRLLERPKSPVESRRTRSAIGVIVTSVNEHCHPGTIPVPAPADFLTMLETWEARSPIRLALESYLVPESNSAVCRVRQFWSLGLGQRVSAFFTPRSPPRLWSAALRSVQCCIPTPSTSRSGKRSLARTWMIAYAWRSRPGRRPEAVKRL